MKRPLAVTGFSYLAALAVALYIGRGCFDALGVIFLAAVVVSLAVKPLREMTFPVFVSLSALAAVVSLGIFTYSRVLPAAGFCGKNAQISAKLTDRPYSSYGRYYYPLRADNIISEDGRSLENVKILISSNKCFDMDLYDTINTDVEFGRNDNISYISKGTMLRGYIPFKAETNIIHESSKPFQYWLTSLKCAVVDEIKYLFPEKQAAVLSAVMTGDKAEIPDDIYDNFRKAGISHIIVLSGTHTTVMVSFVFALLMLLTGKNKRLSALLAALFVLLYMMTVGFTPSVTRAGIMQIIFLLGIAVSRRYDPINSLGLAVLIIILINPYAAADVSLLLSFSAVLGILLLYNRIKNYLYDRIQTGKAERVLNKIQVRFMPLMKAAAVVFSFSVSAYLFTLPVCIVYFRQITVYSVLTNMLISSAVTVIIISMMIMLLLHFSVIFSFIALPFILFCGLLTNYIILVSQIVSSLPFAQINTAREFVPVWLALSIIAALALYFLRKRKLRHAVKIYALSVFAVFVFAMMFNDIANKDITRFSVLDTGNGVSAVVTRDNKAAVFSCGGSFGKGYILREHLEALNINEISYLLITDGNDTGSLYAPDIMSLYDTAVVEVYDEEKQYENMHSLIKECGRTVFRRSEGSDSITHLDDIDIISGVHNKSGFVFAELEGLRFLICSDGTDCSVLSDRVRNCDILIINGEVTNISMVRYKTLFISDSSENRGKYNGLMGDNTLASFDGGNIIVKVHDKRYDIRRENIWLS